MLSFGAIARAIAARAAGFGMVITAHDPFLSADEITAAGAKQVSFDELVTESDCLVIQAPLILQTHHLFNEAQLRRMKPTSILINTARGPIVDDSCPPPGAQPGLDRRRRPRRHRGGAGQGQRLATEQPAVQLGQVVITPHAAYYSEESTSTVRRFAAEEVVRVLTGQAPLSPVNVGELEETLWSRSP